MLRITTSSENGTVWIKLEGKLVGPWVEACRLERARLSRTGAPLRVDLSAVGFVDPAGEVFLRELADAGAIGRSSSFVEELLRPRTSAAEGASEGFVRQHLPAMLALARRLLRRESEAAPAVRSAFHAFLGAEPAPGSRSDRAAELRGRVVDACLARLRARATWGGSIEALLPRFDRAGNHAEPVPPWPSREVVPEALLATARRAVGDLPEAHRIVVLLHDVEGFSLAEIARHLELAPGEVKRLLHQARQALIGLARPALRPVPTAEVVEAARTA